MLQWADGQSNRQVALAFRVKPHAVGMWRMLFEQDGCAGLFDAERSGRTATITPALKQKIVNTVCRKPPKGLGRRSVRSLSASMVIGFSKGLSLLLEDRAVIPPAAEFISVLLRQLATKGGRSC